MSIPRIVATGVGSLPGEDFGEAVRLVLGELPELPHLVELPARGITAGITGRTLAMITDLGFDLQPAGWRLTDASGIDHRRARSLLAQDLDTLEEQAQGYAGELKVQVAGPWTLAATVERPRGDRMLADHGARRELAQALAEGVTGHLADLRRRVPGAELLVQVDEPALPAVLAAAIPTASGAGRHRRVDLPVASAGLEPLFAAIAASGARSVAHCCAAEIPIELLRGAGAGGLSLDLAVLATEAYDDLGTALDQGDRVLLGVVPATDPEHLPTVKQVVDRVQRLLDMLGFDRDDVAGQLVLTPACGLAGATPGYARTALALVRDSAARLNGD
ncbi:MAG: Methionine synthase, vitamin-B12 independent [Marmoricola sp.]|nr:Methionine synthase, vitamin-B12 independent [Marmoricola sp.]